MSEHRLFLSADECAAIRAGRKTQFRRVVKLKPWQGIELRDDGQPWPWMDDGARGVELLAAVPIRQTRRPAVGAGKLGLSRSSHGCRQ